MPTPAVETIENDAPAGGEPRPHVSRASLSTTTLWRRLADPPVVLAALLLAGAAVLAGPVATRLAGVKKEYVPLRAALSTLDKASLGPFRFIEAANLDADQVNTLGTEQYISWQLEDTSVPDPVHPLRFAHLFVTYYSGKPDMVPHVPDVCFKGAGYDVRRGDHVELHIAGLKRDVPVRTVSFVRSGIYGKDEPTVVYTFLANGDFTCTREGVRMAVGDIRARHAYYSKIEVSFGSRSTRPQNATTEQTLEGAARLLNYALPALLERHFPDWEAVQGDSAIATDGEAARPT